MSWKNSCEWVGALACSAVTLAAVDSARLLALFTKPYGEPAPSEAQWRELYADDVHFQDRQRPFEWCNSGGPVTLSGG